MCLIIRAIYDSTNERTNIQAGNIFIPSVHLKIKIAVAVRRGISKRSHEKIRYCDSLVFFFFSYTAQFRLDAMSHDKHEEGNSWEFRTSIARVLYFSSGYIDARNIGFPPFSSN